MTRPSRSTLVVLFAGLLLLTASAAFIQGLGYDCKVALRRGLYPAWFDCFEGRVTPEWPGVLSVCGFLLLIGSAVSYFRDYSKSKLSQIPRQ